jgi:hypothetical protein
MRPKQDPQEKKCSICLRPASKVRFLVDAGDPYLCDVCIDELAAFVKAELDR